MMKLARIFLLLLLPIFLLSCGGEEDVVADYATVTNPDEVKTPIDTPKEEPVVEEEPEPVVLPNPNGVYLPTGEEKNGKPLYANGEGFFMWFNGSLWKISDKPGGGKTISSVQESINDKWSSG